MVETHTIKQGASELTQRHCAQAKNVLTERRVLTKLRSRFVVNLYASFKDAEYLYLVSRPGNRPSWRVVVVLGPVACVRQPIVATGVGCPIAPGFGARRWGRAPGGDQSMLAAQLGCGAPGRGVQCASYAGECQNPDRVLQLFDTPDAALTCPG